MMAVVIVLLIRTFLFTPTLVSGQSMNPNFADRERIIVNKIIYTLQMPKRGDVIVFRAPDGKDYIKRIIALPGETIMVRGDEVLVNDVPLEEEYIKDEIEQAKQQGTSYNTIKNFKLTSSGIEPALVPLGHYFVLGDNRSHSVDSRYESVGFVSNDRIVGRVDFVFWPFTNMRFIH